MNPVRAYWVQTYRLRSPITLHGPFVTYESAFRHALALGYLGRYHLHVFHWLPGSPIPTPEFDKALP